MSEFFSQPWNTFLVGLGIGLAVALYAVIAAFLRRSGLRQENRSLKEQLHRQMTILDKGTEKALDELEGLRKENENLRITLATLKAKPGRAELHTLHVYDRAIRLLHQKAPGFAPAWEGVLAEAQQEIDRADTGLLALVRKAFRPSLNTHPGEAAETGAPPPGARSREA